MLPLEGVRVLGFGLLWAMPTATMMMSDMGAEVIKVESLRYFPMGTRGIFPRPTRELIRNTGYYGRGYPESEPGDRPWNRYAVFNCHARNQLSMTIDLNKPDGQRYIRQLVAVSDLVIENNSPDVMEKLGLGYATLRAINPRIIMIRLPGIALSGPYRDFRGTGATIEAICGLTSLRGYVDGDPSTAGASYYMDSASAGVSVFALLAALERRDETGEGSLIEIPQSENLLNHMGEAILEYSMNARAPAPLGNFHPAYAPQGAYRSKGEDRWVGISVTSDSEFVKLCEAIGRPELATDPRYASPLVRRRNQEALRGPIEAWTAQRTHREAAATLQDAGVPAGPVLAEPDAYEDPHLNARGFFSTWTTPDTGTYRYPGHLWRYHKTPLRYDRPAPTLGQDNEYVYKTILGVDDAEYRRLIEEGHIGDTYLPPVLPE
jgi:benzylsuccinate CoA-transferase BbsF subunit/naphthyl-2-methylsuccinate CoA transferase subunit